MLYLVEEWRARLPRVVGGLAANRLEFSECFWRISRAPAMRQARKDVCPVARLREIGHDITNGRLISIGEGQILPRDCRASPAGVPQAFPPWRWRPVPCFGVFCLLRRGPDRWLPAGRPNSRHNRAACVGGTAVGACRELDLR